MRNGEPIEDLLLLFSPDTIVGIKEIQKGGLGFLQGRICTVRQPVFFQDVSHTCAGLQITEIREDSFFELLAI